VIATADTWPLIPIVNVASTTPVTQPGVRLRDIACGGSIRRRPSRYRRLPLRRDRRRDIHRHGLR
jgi:hypothetical protein